MNESKQNQSSGEAPEQTAAGQRKSGYRNEVATGLAIVLTILFVYFGVRYLEGRPIFGGTYDLFAEFESANGLSTGSSVEVSGVKVGEVTRIRLREASRGVRVRMEIEEDVAIPEGSVASIEGIGALDNVSIAIEPGPEGRPLLEDGDTLQTQPAGDVLGQVDSTLAGAREAFSEAESLISGTEQDLNIILREMQTASGEAALLMSDSRGRVRATLTDLQSAAADLNTFAAQMQVVAHQLERTTGQGGDTLVTAINRLNALMERLDGVVVSLERGSTSLESFAVRADTSDGTLGRLMSDPSLYLRLDSAAMNLNEILSSFKEDPKRYLKHLELIDVF